MSTTFVVRVAKGTQSVVGPALTDDFEFTFSTPTVTLEFSYPSNRDVFNVTKGMLYLEFNQKVKPEGVLANATLECGSGNSQLTVKNGMTHYVFDS